MHNLAVQAILYCTCGFAQTSDNGKFILGNYFELSKAFDTLAGIYPSSFDVHYMAQKTQFYN